MCAKKQQPDTITHTPRITRIIAQATTMTDETILTPAAAADPVVDDISPPENDANGATASGKNKDNKGEKEQVPIEDLYDLSKPIKKVRLCLMCLGIII